MKYILFIRHVETIKNSKNEFSKANKGDSLTSKGEDQAIALVKFIKKFILDKKLKAIYIYTSTSSRSVDTARLISNNIGMPIKEIQGLTSFDLGEIGGLNETETESFFPHFFSQLKLYRNGLFNSYSISYPNNAEKPLDFEKRVYEGLQEIFLYGQEDLKIIILHRSVLTATYILFARKYYNYPSDFYGFVPVDNGCLTLVEKVEDYFKFVFVNEKPENIFLNF